MKINPAMVKSTLLVVAAFSLFMLPGLKLPYLDKKADTYFSDAITGAGLAYGVCRVINASVSVIKESQVQIAPVGSGISLAAGQVFDPLDDLTERASDILVTAIVSLGIQKIVYELSVEFAPLLMGIAIAALAAVSFCRGARAKALRLLVLKLIILIGVARLCLPASAMISSCLNDHYFSPRITKTQNELVYPELERLKNMRFSEGDGFFRMIESFVKEKISDLRTVWNKINVESIIAGLLTLSYLYVAFFIIQVILLPLGTFWLLARITNTLCGTDIPCILKHDKAAGPGNGPPSSES